MPKSIRDLPNEILDKIADQAATPTNRKGYIAGIDSKYYVNKMAWKYGGVKNIPDYYSQGWEREVLYHSIFPGRSNLMENMFGPQHKEYTKYNPYKLPPTYAHVNNAYNEIGDSTEQLVEKMDRDWKEIHDAEIKEKDTISLRALQKLSKKKDAYYL